MKIEFESMYSDSGHSGWICHKCNMFIPTMAQHGCNEKCAVVSRPINKELSKKAQKAYVEEYGEKPDMRLAMEHIAFNQDMEKDT